MAVLLLLSAAAAATGRAEAVTLDEAAGSYVVTPSSTVTFSVSNVSGGALVGRFVRFEGRLKIDGDDLSTSSVDFTLYPESVATGQARADAFLRSEAVFDVAAHPQVDFHSTSVKRTSETTAHIEGNLTARGITKSASFDVALFNAGDRLLVFDVEGDVLRSPFGMDVGTPIYSNVVHFEMRLKVVRQ